jgi:hypothetical protein
MSRVFEGDWVGENEDDMGELVLKDGRKVIDFEGCDWKENPAKILTKLARKLAKLGDTYDIVEIADGSDTLWFGIVPVKIPKVKAKPKLKKYRVARTVTCSEWYEVKAKSKAELQLIVKSINLGNTDLDDVGEYVGEGGRDNDEVRIV